MRIASQTVVTQSERPALPRTRHYQLLNVCLEEGFEREGNEVIATRTALYDITINDGKFTAIDPAGSTRNSDLANWDAQGLLLLPRTRDMHIHLDKTFYSGPWQAPRPRQGKTIMDMIAREQVLIPQLLPTSQARAEALIGLLQSKGSTKARSHCNIDPVSGLKSLEHLKLALANHPDFDCEIVAFPQHGLLHSKVDGLMREAMVPGVHYVGGLDPTNVDSAMQASLDAMFQIALDLYAQLYRGSDEFGLSRALHIATGGILPLSNQGERQWPQVQDEASMMLVAASCSAEAVARIAPVHATFRRGTAVYAA